MHHGNQLRLTERADLICARRLQEAQAESFAASQSQDAWPIVLLPKSLLTKFDTTIYDVQVASCYKEGAKNDNYPCP